MSCRNAEAASVIRVMIRNAKQTIVVADHSKLRAISTYQICPASEIGLLITDSAATDNDVAALVAHGIEVRRV